MTEEQVKALIKQMIADGDLVIQIVDVTDNEEAGTGHQELKIVATY
tara:strand:+ start:121 stop:258 length:138 start_codon:yes stop_codon:yes gene_type:complete